MLRRLLPAALLLAVTLASWAGALQVPLHFDDYDNLLNDEATRDLGALRQRLHRGVRPLLRVSFFVDHALFGDDPRGGHAVNLALHCGTVLLVWALARRRLGEAAALCAAAVFAVQPAHAEVVAYLSGRSTGLMSALLLAALLCFERADAARGRRRILGALAAAALALAACLTKEVALVFPLLLLVWRPQRSRAAAWALLLAAATAVLLALSPRYRYLAGFALDLRGPLEALRVNLGALPLQLSLWLRPTALSVDHGLAAAAVGAAAVGVGALLVTGALLTAWLARRRAPLLTLALLWPLVALLPTSGALAKLDLVTEKPLYLAWLGPSLCCGALVAWARRRAGRVALGAAAALVLVMAGASARRVVIWQDARTLWADAVAKAPDNARAWSNLGKAHALHHQPRPARAAFLQALRLDPEDVVVRQNLARLSLGID